MRAAGQPVGISRAAAGSRDCCADSRSPKRWSACSVASDWRSCDPLPALAELAQHLGFSGLYRAGVRMPGACARASTRIIRMRTTCAACSRCFPGDMAASAGVDTARAGRSNRAWPMPTGWCRCRRMRNRRSRTSPKCRRVMTAAQPGSEARAYFDYSLHHSLHALGRHEDAWRALASGHAAMRRLVRYSRDEQHELFGGARKHGRCRVFDPQPAADGQTGLIFIVGMFRSGTTLIERVLAGHPDVVGRRRDLPVQCLHARCDRPR